PRRRFRTSGCSNQTRLRPGSYILRFHKFCYLSCLPLLFLLGECVCSDDFSRAFIEGTTKVVTTSTIFIVSGNCYIQCERLLGMKRITLHQGNMRAALC